MRASYPLIEGMMFHKLLVIAVICVALFPIAGES
jgi:hypothetical protein